MHFTNQPMDLFSYWKTNSWRMFEANLIISTVVLVLAWWMYSSRRRALVGDPESRPRHGLRNAAIVLLPTVILFVFGLLGRLQLVQLLALLLLSVACGSRNWPSRRFAAVGLVATLFLASAVGVQGVLQAARAGKQHPMKSLAQRLESKVRTPRTPAPLSSAAVASLETIEKQLSNKMERQIFGRYQKRRAALEMIHASQVMQFISSEGFGIGRSLTPTISDVELPGNLALSQPAVLATASRSTGDRPTPWLPVPRTGATYPALNTLHFEASVQFLDPVRFGFVRDVEHVAGFQPHALRDIVPLRRQFQRDQQTSLSDHRRWVLERVELVSLLLHDEPGVYVSENLPRMDELAGTRLRSLNRFEVLAMNDLRNGESLVVRGQGDQLKMLGSLRAARQCAACHRVPRGTLLGAFSYGFRDQTSQRSSR